MSRFVHSRRRRLDLQHHDIPTKANRILHLILIAIFLIIIRIWHLAVIQYDQKLQESHKPQRKTIIEPATRATIRDRFNLPLALNRIHYQATVLYSQLREIPTFVWQKNDQGKRTKIFKRKEYINQLAHLLSQELKMDAERIEDLIHAKASYYSQVPFVIKEDISESEYYRLKMLEKDWPGIHMRRLPKRYYPRGRVGADVIGYMGAINKQEYEKILHEIKALEQFITEREEGIENDLPVGIESSTQARKRLKDLEEKAYTIHDYIGKTGIEGIYEHQLRGFYGKKVFYSDSKGNFLRELPGSRAPLSGHRVLLTISAELQEYVEQLLAQNEEFRQVRKSGIGAIKNTIIAQKHPWIKGGAAVVLNPHNGELLALASYPRFDPNDFISSGQPLEQKQKKEQIIRWFENDTYIGNVWDQQQFLERERYDHLTKMFFDEKRLLTWSAYLDFILPQDSPLLAAINRISTINHAVNLQKLVDDLRTLYPDWDLYTIFNCLYTGDEHESYHFPTKSAERQKLLAIFQVNQEQAKKIKKHLDPYLDQLVHHYDKVLLIDLCRLAVNSEKFNSKLIQEVGNHTLEYYHQLRGNLVKLLPIVKESAKELFHAIDYKEWRKKEEKSFLKNKRNEEKIAKTYPKPYLDYLDQKERNLFQSFWETYRWDLFMIFLTGSASYPIEQYPSNWETYFNFFKNRYEEINQEFVQNFDWKDAYKVVQKTLKPLSSTSKIAYLQTIRSYQELTRPLLGRYRYLRNAKEPLEKHLAGAFYPVYGFGYARSHAYRQAAIQGSLFKIVTSFAALIQRFQKLDKKMISFLDLNPLTIVDEVYSQGNVRYVGYTDDGKPIPQMYKGGRLPRSLAHQHNGRVDLIRALEVSSNPYFSLLAGECLEKAEDLSDAAHLFSYGNRTGIDLPGEIPGKVPCDLSTNRTGLYAMAIGQHSLVVTPLQTAVMLSAIANGGKIIKPKIVTLTAGRQPMRGNDQITCPPNFAYQDSLSMIGLDFPFFSAVSSQDQDSLVKVIPTEVKREIFMPEIVRQIILKGLRAAVCKTHQESIASLTKLYKQYPEAICHFTELKDQILGKTSTSEAVENIDLDLTEGTSIYTHVWFGSIAFEKETKDKNVFILKDEFGQPELVIVVYLRFGGYGKEAAPIAAQILKKWRELKEKYKDKKG